MIEESERGKQRQIGEETNIDCHAANHGEDDPLLALT